MPKYTDIEDAIEFVSSALPEIDRVVYDKRTKQFYYSSELSDEDEIPEDLDWDQCVEIPHKTELDLGENLVFQFIEQYLPDEEETIYRIFSRPGAYRRFKVFLKHHNMLQQWYDFEEMETRRAVKEWCEENAIEIDE